MRSQRLTKQLFSELPKIPVYSEAKEKKQQKNLIKIATNIQQLQFIKPIDLKIRNDLENKKLKLQRQNLKDLRQEKKHVNKQQRQILQQKIEEAKEDLQKVKEIKKQHYQELKQQQEKQKKINKVNRILKKYTKKEIKNERYTVSPLLNKQGRPVEDRFANVTRKSYKIQGAENLEQVYKSIRQFQRPLNANTIVLVRQKDGKTRYMTIQTGHMTSYQKFLEFYEKMALKEYQTASGSYSDPINPDDEIDMENFSLMYASLEGQGGKSKSLFYILHQQPKNDKTQCFLYCLEKIYGKNDDIKNLVDKVTKDNKVSYQDALEICETLNIKLLNGDLFDQMETFTNKTITVKNKVLEEVKISFEKKYDRFIFFDGKHYSNVESFKKLYLDPFKNLVNDKAKILMKRSDLIYMLQTKSITVKNNGKELQPSLSKCEPCQVHFDFETLFDTETGKLFVQTVQFKLFNKLYVYQGKDCIKKFIELLLDDQYDNMFILVGYNSSRFDNFFIMEYLVNETDYLNSVFFQGNSILQMRFGNRHQVFDLCRFTATSLQKACDDFQIKQKKKELNENIKFQKIQNHYSLYNEINTLLHDKGCKNFDKDIEIKCDEEIKIDFGCKCKNFVDFITYGVYDVLSLEELYNKIDNIIIGVIQDLDQERKHFFDFKTIGSMIYKLFKHSTKNINLPLFDLSTYKMVKSGLVAGRTQCYKTDEQMYDLSGRNIYRMVDCKSLYPYACLNFYYPCGEIIIGDYQECVQQDLIGFYEVEFSQENCKKNVLPLRQVGKQLNWNYKGIIKTFINTVDIQSLKEQGATIHSIGDGFYFSQKIHGKELFSCMQKFKEIKEEQDKLKEEKSDQYNNALRQMAKLFLNSLTGKVIERIHQDQNELVRNQSSYDNIIKKDIDAQINYVCGRSAVMSYRISEEDALKNNNRPIYLGCLIYSYARKRMMDTVLQYDCIYQDTDSGVFIEQEYQKMIKEHPEYMGNQFGDFEEEAGSGKMKRYCTLAPKNYFIWDENDQLIKKGFKGINLKKDGDRYIDKEDLIRLGFKFTKTGNPKLPKMNQIDKIKFMMEVWNLLEKQQMCQLDYIDKFVKEQIKKGGQSFIVCSSLQKVIKNRGQMKGGSIYQTYIVKKIESNPIQ